MLRVVCLFTVILLHASGYFNKIAEPGSADMLMQIAVNSICRFVIPVYIYLAGAFAMRNNKNIKPKYFYKRKYNEVIKLFIIFSVIYVIYDYIGEIIYFLQGQESEFLRPIINVFLGEPYYHLWFICVLIILYLLTPLLIFIKNKIGELNFAIIGILLTIICLVIRYFIEKPFWIINALLYVGYFILGYVLYNLNSIIKRVKVRFFVVVIILATSGFILNYYFRYKYEFLNYNEKIVDYLYSPLSFVNMLNSVLIFILFMRLNINSLSKFTEYFLENTYLIFLIHAGVASVLNVILSKYYNHKGPFSAFIYIGIFTILIIFLSVLLGEVFKKVSKILLPRRRK